MLHPKRSVFVEDHTPLQHRTSEDEWDWEENHRRSAGDYLRVDRAFLTGWAGITGMWLALAIVASGALGAIHIIALWAHH